MQLAQVLPIDERNKLALLTCNNSIKRLEMIDAWLDEVSG
jgi:Lon protease-like protein